MAVVFGGNNVADNPLARFSREQIGRIWQQQQQRAAEERERVRQAVADSHAPLSDDLAAAVIAYFISDMRDIMRGHVGYPLAERRNSYKTSLSIMRQCMQDLLSTIDSFEELAVSNEFYERGRQEKSDAFVREVQKELFATTNAAVSLVEHARRVVKLHPLPAYDKKRTEVFGADGLHEFITGLRVLLHHLHIVDAGWRVTQSFTEGTKTATFMLQKSELQRLAEVYRTGLTSAQYNGITKFLALKRDKIDLREIARDYSARIELFHAWMSEELDSPSLVALRDYDSLHKRKQHRDQRMMWSGLLGNWLNWKVAPDPHKHLDKWLTVDELAEVYSLPRNSKEQVDLVIKYMDSEGAIDDGIRKQVYELFRRSPPE